MATFLTVDDAQALLEPSGFRTGDTNPWGTRLYLPRELTRGEHRADGRPPSSPGNLPQFVAALDEWLPGGGRHVLWISRAESAAVELEHAILAVRGALGEQRSVDEAPCLLFDAVSPIINGELPRSTVEARETSLICSLVCLLLIAEWDGLLFAINDTDRVELWEGNVLFHSRDPDRLGMAAEIFQRCGCPRSLA